MGRNSIAIGRLVTGKREDEAKMCRIVAVREDVM